MKQLFHFVLFVGVLAPAIRAEQRLSPIEARAHVGEHATVCGTVASGHYAMRSGGRPTFLNLDIHNSDMG